MVETLLPGGSSMNGMNLSGKPGIVQPMQMPPTFGQPPIAVDPAALRDVAVDDRAPAAELDQALRRAVLGGELTLLVVAGPVAALVHGRAEQPLRSQLGVERDHRRLAGDLVEQVEDRLGQVVRVDRATGHAHDRQAGLRLPVPAEVVGHAHRAGRVARPSRGSRRTSRRSRPRSPRSPSTTGGPATRWSSAARRSPGRCRSRRSSRRCPC